MIDFFVANFRHYLDHLAPLWLALPPEERGYFYVTGPGLTERAWELGIGQHPEAGRVTGGMPPKAGPPIVIAGGMELMYLPAGRPIALLEHGAGQSYVHDDPSLESNGYSGGPERDRVSLFLCPGETSAARNRSRYPDTPSIAIGPANLDRFVLPSERRPPPEFLSPTATGAPPDIGKPDDSDSSTRARAAFAFHWDCRYLPETTSAWPHWRAFLTFMASRSDGYDLVVTAHPRNVTVRAWAEATPGLRWGTYEEALSAAVLHVDNSSIAPEYLAVNPDGLLVLMNAPWYRRSVEHGMRFWEWTRWGVLTLDEPGETIAEDDDRQALAFAAQRRVVAQSYDNLCDGHAAERGAKELMAWAT